MICGDLVRPDPGWLLASSGLQLLTSEMARTRDPDAFAALRQACDDQQVSPLTRDLSLVVLQRSWPPRAASSRTSPPPWL